MREDKGGSDVCPKKWSICFASNSVLGGSEIVRRYITYVQQLIQCADDEDPDLANMRQFLQLCSGMFCKIG